MHLKHSVADSAGNGWLVSLAQKSTTASVIIKHLRSQVWDSCMSIKAAPYNQYRHPTNLGPITLQSNIISFKYFVMIVIISLQEIMPNYN